MTVHNFACLYDTETGCVCVSEKPFHCRQHSKDDCLSFFLHGNLRLTWVSDTHAWTLPLVWDTHNRICISFPSLAPCCKSPPNISTRSCHCALWAALRSQGQVARWRKILEKILKGDVKNTAHNFEQKWQKMGWTNWSRNLGKTWQQWRQGIQPPPPLLCKYASSFRHVWHASSVVLIRKRKTRACLTRGWNMF